MRSSIPLMILLVCTCCVPMDTPPMVDPGGDAEPGPDGGPLLDAHVDFDPEPLPDPDPDPDPGTACAEIVPGVAEPVDPMAELDGPYHRCGVVGLGQISRHAWLPDGAVITGSPNGTVARVEADGGITWRRVAFGGPVVAIDTAEDGRVVVAADASGWVLISAADGTVIHRAASPEGLLQAVALHPTRCAVASGSLVERGERGLVVGPVDARPDWRSGGPLSTLALAYSPDGSMLAAVRKGNGHTLGEPLDTEVQVRAVADGALLHRVPGEVVAWSPGSDALWVGHEDGGLTHLDVRTGATTTEQIFEPAELRGDAPRNMSDLAVLPDGRLMVARRSQSALHILHPESLAFVSSLGIPGLGPVSVSPDGSMLMLSLDGELETVAIDRLDGPRWARGTGWAPRLSMAHDGTLAALTTRGVAMVMPGGEVEAAFSLPIGRVGTPPSVALSPDGGRLLFSANGSGLHVVDLATGIPEGPLLDSPESTSAIAISPGGRMAAAALGASRIALWTIDDGARPTHLPREPINTGGAIFDRVRAIAFSPDGRWLAAAGGGFYTSRIWSLDDLAEQTFGPKANALVFDPDSSGMLALPFSNNPPIAAHFALPDLDRSDLALDATPTALAWTRAGIWTAASRSTTLRDPVTGEVYAVLPGAVAIAATPDGEAVAIVNRHLGLELWCASH